MIQDFCEKRGDTVVKTLTFTDSTGAAINITGWTIFLTLKNNPNDADSVKVLQVTAALTTPLSGIATITLTATQTAALSGIYYYDVQYKKSDGTTIGTILMGKFLFDKDVSIAIT
jgi:hypothetical protein